MKTKITLIFLCVILLVASSFAACNKSSSDVQVNSNTTFQATAPVYTDAVEITSAEEPVTDAPLNEGPIYAMSGETYFVTGIGNCNDTTVIIPDTYKDLPIIAIKNSAFESCTSFTKAVLGSNITEIGSSAFAGCASLTSIELPEGLEVIQDMAFENSGLTSITIPSTVTKLGNNCFAGCGNLQSIYYNGTMEQWKAIKKGNMMYLECGTSGAICTDGSTSY